jgi:hypothetical protein
MNILHIGMIKFYHHDLLALNRIVFKYIERQEPAVVLDVIMRKYLGRNDKYHIRYALRSDSNGVCHTTEEFLKEVREMAKKPKTDQAPKSESKAKPKAKPKSKAK